MLKRDFQIKNTQNNFSKIAWFYDFWGKLTESKAISRAVSISDISDDSSILDVGVGTGQLFNRILSRNKKGLNFGIDLSPGMISKAKLKFTAAKVKNLLTIGNALYLPYKSESIDYLFSSYVLDLLPEEKFSIVLNEFNRVLKTGGTGLLIMMSMGEKWYNKAWYLLARYFPSILTNCRPVELSRPLTEAGFSIETKETVSQNTFPSEIIKFSKH